MASAPRKRAPLWLVEMQRDELPYFGRSVSLTYLVTGTSHRRRTPKAEEFFVMDEISLLDALSPDWGKCETCGEMKFIPKRHTDCYDCLNIFHGGGRKSYRKIPIPYELRIAVFKRDGFTCKHCGSKENLHADHIFPESKGGQATMENLQTLCKSCNCKKGDR